MNNKPSCFSCIDYQPEHDGKKTVNRARVQDTQTYTNGVFHSLAVRVGLLGECE